MDQKEQHGPDWHSELTRAVVVLALEAGGLPV